MATWPTEALTKKSEKISDRWIFYERKTIWNAPIKALVKEKMLGILWKERKKK
jgi:hypothetical protein